MIRTVLIERTTGECDLCGEELTANDILQAEKGSRNVYVTAEFDGMKMKSRGVMCSRCKDLLVTWQSYQIRRETKQKQEG